jgi:NAD(P)-dependent dehydrogenase (short-subunit alcohol dehydrogenase family)
MTCARKHVLVTGASSGIGRAAALRLAAAGRHVYAGVRSDGDAADLAGAAGNGLVTPVPLDVTNPDQIGAATAAIAGHVAEKGLDGLVNNAGVGLATPLELLPPDTFRQHLEINVIGQLLVTQAVLPLLRQARGRIVMVGSIGVRFAPPFAGPLDASKAALTAMGDALRQELAPWGIRVILVEPASVNSAAADKVARQAADALAQWPAAGRALYQDSFERMLAVMRRREAAGSSPDVVAATIDRALFAVRPKGSYLTGRFARRMALISRLPTPALDAVRRAIFRLPAPGSLT